MLLIFLGSVLLLVYISSDRVQINLLKILYPGETQFTHSRVSLLSMTIVHILLTLSATALSVIFGAGFGILVTRKAGRDFQAIILRLNGLVQTFPPSAVIILAFPLLGFGWKPTLLALFLYSLFPVIGNTVMGFKAVDPLILDAAEGLGMSERQKLSLVEIPQALPLIMTGIRHAFILNIGTASIGAIIGAGGLGTIIMSGLVLQNSALVFSGALTTVALALLGEQCINLVEKIMLR